MADRKVHVKAGSIRLGKVLTYEQAKALGSKIDITETERGQLTQKLFKGYDELLQKDLAKGNLSKTPSFKVWAVNKYGQTAYKTAMDTSSTFSQVKEFSIPAREEYRGTLLKKLVEDANKGTKLVKWQDILSKVSDGPRYDQSYAGQKYYSLLHKEADKVRIAFDKIVDADEIIEWPTKRTKFSKFHTSPLTAMIAERTGVSNRGYIDTVLSQGVTDKGKDLSKLEVYKPRHTYPKELLTTASKTGVIELSKPFSEILEEAEYRKGGGVTWSKTTLRPDTANTINDFALRHWDYHKKHKTLNSQIEFYWNNKFKNGKPAVVEWDKIKPNKRGVKSLKGSEVFFKYKNPLTGRWDQREWDTTKLRRDGRQSKLFEEVYVAKKAYNQLLTKMVPHPRTGEMVTFEDLMKRTYKKGYGLSDIANVYALDHEKLVADKPFNALRVASNRLNNQLNYISRFTEQKNFKKILMNALDVTEFDDPLKAGQKLAEKVLVEGYKVPVNPGTGQPMTAATELAHTVLKKDLSKLTAPMVNQLVNRFSTSARPEVVIPILEAAQLDSGNICKKIFGKGVRYGKQAGGLHGGCAVQMADALNNEPKPTLNKLKNLDVKSGPLLKVKNAAVGFLGALGRFGPAAGKYGAIAAAGALAQPLLVKQFMNDDPSTYLTDPDQQAAMLEELIERQERTKPRSEILDTAVTGTHVAGTAAAVPGTGALWKARRAKGMGVPRAALGPVGKFIAGAYTPAGLLAMEPLRIAQMRREGESWGEVAKSPTLWMGPAFADTMTRMATRGMRAGSPLARGLSLGMSRPMLKTISRRFGMPGLALSLGLSGYDQYQDFKKKRGFFARDED